MVKKDKPTWTKEEVRAFRNHMGWTQQDMADKLGTRQQTISEWELGLYLPRGTSTTLLGMVAEKAGFQYQPRPAEGTQISRVKNKNKSLPRR
ncbi:MAG: helix-turn-helix transcriptional regulator [Dehalococcoidia bacterium]|nr:helix-turn-helix transcriptional regulator [Dehalococcoidia bacterium]